MEIAEKIKTKQEKITLCERRITQEQEKISKLKQEIDTLQNLEVKFLLKEIDRPFDEVRALLLQKLKTNPTAEIQMVSKAESPRNVSG